MLTEEAKQAVNDFFEIVETQFNTFLKNRTEEEYEAAAQLILDAQASGNRLHITGIGKPGHVSTYMASLFSSTGNPCYFLHGTEAVHGSCGQLVKGDVVICISNSGETSELKSTVQAVKENNCKIIGVAGNPESWLAKKSDAFLFAGIDQEGGPLNRAPRSSILAELLTLQALSVALQVQNGWTPEQYIRCHPGGILGQLRDNERGEG